MKCDKSGTHPEACHEMENPWKGHSTGESWQVFLQSQMANLLGFVTAEALPLLASGCLCHGSLKAATICIRVGVAVFQNKLRYFLLFFLFCFFFCTENQNPGPCACTARALPPIELHPQPTSFIIKSSGQAGFGLKTVTDNPPPAPTKHKAWHMVGFSKMSATHSPGSACGLQFPCSRLLVFDRMLRSWPAGAMLQSKTRRGLPSSRRL